jgi:hypothetical protein
VSIPAALACLGVIAWAPGVVLAMASSHQEAMVQQTGGAEVLQADHLPR